MCSKKRNGRQRKFSWQVIKFINDTSAVLVSGCAFLSVFVMANNFTFIMLACALANAVLGKILKLITAQARPTASRKADRTYGMPSSHANSLFYFVSFLTIGAFLEFGLWCALKVGFLLSTYTMIVLYCRVEIDKDHTWLQVIVGGIIGSLVGLFTLLYIIPNEAVNVCLSNMNVVYYLRKMKQKPEVITMGIGLILFRTGNTFIDVDDVMNDEADDENIGQIDYEEQKGFDWMGGLWGIFSECEASQTSSDSINNELDVNFHSQSSMNLFATPIARSKHVDNKFGRGKNDNKRYSRRQSGRQMVAEAHAGWCNEITNILFCCCVCKPHSFVDGIISDDENCDEPSTEDMRGNAPVA